MNVGIAGPPDRWLSRAVSWPARKRAGAVASWTGTRSRLLACRSGDGFAQTAAHVVAAVGVRIEDGGVGADRFGRQLQAVEDQVRGQPQQGGVLVAGGLALRAVGDDRGGAAALVGGVEDGLELAVHRERGAAPAREPGGLDVPDEDALAVAVREPAVPVQVRTQVLLVLFARLLPG
jgi:hypothetical protein